MRPLRYSINVTLDGCCDHREMVADEELHRHAAETLGQADALLFGRVTYEMMEAAWRPSAQTGAMPDWMEPWMEPFARTIDAAKKYVVSSTLERVDWNAELVRGDLGEAVRQLKREPGKGLGVGGVKLPQALAELGLIDEYEFVVHPRVAGHGPTLFAGLSKRLDLKLVGRLEFGSGAVAMRYELRPAVTDDGDHARDGRRDNGRRGMPPDYVIAPAAAHHLEALGAVELGAASRFLGWPVPPAMFEETTSPSVFEAAQASGHLWVALSPAGDCVGFALVEPSGVRLHLEELDVLPDHAGRGLGRALVSEVERWAADNRFAEITLTSYRDVPWNAPFYARLGFAILEPTDLDAELAARLAAEAARGLDTMPRVALRKRVRPTGGGALESAR